MSAAGAVKTPRVESAPAGGASPVKAAIRVTFWGALALAITAAVGRFVGTAV